MIFLVLLVGATPVVVTLIFLILFHSRVSRRTQYTVSRLFLKKDETMKALKSFVVGSFIFAVGRILALLYALRIVSGEIIFVSNLLAGEALVICFLYAFYKVLKITASKTAEI